jgi:hypothetical protein
MVSMVQHRSETGKSSSHNTSFDSEREACPIPALPAFINHTSAANEDRIITIRASKDDEDKPYGPKFDWNEKDQGLIMGSFFWGYVVLIVIHVH